MLACGGCAHDPQAEKVLGASPPARQGAALDRIVVRASVVSYDGSAARLALRIDGVQTGTASIASAAMQDVIFHVSPPRDGGVLELVYLNGAVGTIDRPRRLIVESIDATGTFWLPSDRGVQFDQGEGAAAFDDQLTSPGRSVLVESGALRVHLPSRQVVSGAFGSLNGVSTQATAPGVYVNAETGNDQGPGSFARPWRTLARVARARLAPGEGIYLRCGQVWRESLGLNASHLADGATIAGYGADCDKRPATLSGADDFSGQWTVDQGVWSRSLPASTAKITQLFVAGVPMRTAQWPNLLAGPARAGTPSVNHDAGSKMLLTPAPADAAQLRGRDLNGAAVQVHTQSWLIEPGRLKAGNSALLELDRPAAWPVQPGQRYVLQDKRWMLDEPGEFFHDTTAQKLYLILPGAFNDPNTESVLGSVRDVALDLSDRSGLKVQNIAVVAAREAGLRLTNAPAAVLSSLAATDNGDAGIRVAQWNPVAPGTAGPRVEDCVVSGNARFGIDLNFVERAIVRRNRVLGTGTAKHHVGSVLAGIAAGPGAHIEDNVVDGAGYNGITFSSRSGSVVARNTLSRYCTKLADCGAIYTWTDREKHIDDQSARLEGNRIFQGEPDLDAAPAADRELVVGIYLDDTTRNVKVWNNLVYGASMGILLHNASGIDVARNRVWLAARAALLAIMDRSDADWLTNNQFHDNEIVPRVVARGAENTLPTFDVSLAVWFEHSLAGAAALAPTRNSFSDNSVLQLQGPLQAHARIKDARSDRWVDGLDWAALASDATPQQPVRYVPLVLMSGKELLEDSHFSSVTDNWLLYQNPAGAGFAVKSKSGGPNCPATCVRLTAGHPGDLIGSRSFQLKGGALYAYAWSAVMPPDKAASVGIPYVSRASAPWDRMNDARGVASYLSRGAEAAERVDYAALFVAKESAAARVNVQMETLHAPVTFEFVSLREVSSTLPARLGDWSALAFAPAGSPRSVDCSDLGWPEACKVTDLHGRALEMPLHLPAGREQLLLRANSVFRRSQ